MTVERLRRHRAAQIERRLGAGDAPLVRDVLGHSKASFTIDNYIKPAQKASAKGKDALNAAFGGSS
jgi:hypothetical protein